MEPNSTSEIQISFHSAERATMEGGDGAYIFFFTVMNLRPKRAKLFVSPSLYTTQEGEEIDQDVWLAGIGNGGSGFTLSSGTFKKIGCVYYDRKLPRFSNGDKLLLTAWIDASSISHDFLFECTDAPKKKFELLSSSLEPRLATEQELTTPSKSGGDNSELTHLVERLEVLEEDFGVSVEGIYFTWSMDYANRYQVNFNFDVIATNRDRVNEIMAKTINEGFKIQVNFYNQNGQLISAEENYISQEKFPGFCSVSSRATMNQIPSRIRLFPIKCT
jgi:hypothetical protein